MCTACGTRAHDAAVAVAKKWAAAHGHSGAVTCSNGIGGINTRTPDFICQVRIEGTTCNQFEVHRFGGRWHVTPRRRGVSCVLPA